MQADGGDCYFELESCSERRGDWQQFALDIIDRYNFVPCARYN